MFFYEVIVVKILIKILNIRKVWSLEDSLNVNVLVNVVLVKCSKNFNVLILCGW